MIEKTDYLFINTKQIESIRHEPNDSAVTVCFANRISVIECGSPKYAEAFADHLTDAAAATLDAEFAKATLMLWGVWAIAAAILVHAFTK